RYSRRQVLRTAGLGAASIGLGSALLVYLEACATGSTGSTSSGGTLKFGLSSYPPSFNPFLNTGAAAQAVLWSIHRGLVGYDAKGGFRGEIAQAWDIPSNTEYVFHLRQNAVFHIGDA